MSACERLRFMSGLRGVQDPHQEILSNALPRKRREYLRTWVKCKSSKSKAMAPRFSQNNGLVLMRMMRGSILSATGYPLVVQRIQAFPRLVLSLFAVKCLGNGPTLGRPNTHWAMALFRYLIVIKSRFCVPGKATPSYPAIVDILREMVYERSFLAYYNIRPLQSIYRQIFPWHVGSFLLLSKMHTIGFLWQF